MDEFTSLLTNYNLTDVLVILAMAYMAIRWIVKSVREHKSDLKDKNREYYNEEKEKESIIDRIELIEKNDKEQTDNINNLRHILELNGQLLTSMRKSQDEVVIAMCRNTLRTLHDEFMKAGEISEEELKVFTEIGNVYENAGGNDIYHYKLKPDVLSLPMKQD